MRSNRGSLLALAFTLLAGAAFIAPQSPSRSPKVGAKFFQEDRSQVKQTENKMKLGGVWDAIDAVDAYTKKGSGSIQGPLAGVPWLTVIYFVIFFWCINLFVTEGGGKADRPV
ncbi:tRNA (Uracil(54)-C(5))-methyltransferase [Durusdinium trenchii]|uniref:tRNA (Uracil(54)-C(5))-methyltransferase n=1 Tax=Durusdinium trenchii TaxID=1381693 RepID=A0ABP0LQN3_9DINO